MPVICTPHDMPKYHNTVLIDLPLRALNRIEHAFEARLWILEGSDEEEGINAWVWDTLPNASLIARLPDRINVRSLVEALGTYTGYA